MLKIVSVAFISGTLLVSNSTFATNNRVCIDRLTGEHKSSRAVKEFVREVAEKVRLTYPRARLLSDIEIEVWADLMVGLPMSVSFGDGRETLLRGDRISMDVYESRLQESAVTKVTYAPLSLARIGRVLSLVCRTVRPDLGAECDVYEDYRGLTDPSPRPFSPRQEQVLKGAILNLHPDESMVQAFQQYSAVERSTQMKNLRAARLTQAEHLIDNVFPARESRIIYEKIVYPMSNTEADQFASRVDRN